MWCAHQPPNGSMTTTSRCSCCVGSDEGGRSSGGVVGHVSGVAWLEERLTILGITGFDLPATLHLGVELCSEQDRDVRHPQPDQEHHDSGDAPVCLVVGAE